METVLIAVVPPAVIYLVFWSYIRAGKKDVNPASRRFMALFASGLFLVVPLLFPPALGGDHAGEIRRIMIGAFGVCSLGMAITALRLMPSRPGKPLIFIVLSGFVSRDVPALSLGEVREGLPPSKMQLRVLPVVPSPLASVRRAMKVHDALLILS
jgi:hypothetical protein